MSVSIEPTCILCDTCRTICPAVFVVCEDKCEVRAEAARDLAFLRLHGAAILDAAAACPVCAIKVETEPAMGNETCGEVQAEAGMNRRRFTAASAGWIALAGSGAIGALGLQRFMYPAVTDAKDPRVTVGPVVQLAQMAAGSVKADYKRQGFWIVRLADRLTALSTACPHLGCVLDWQASERQFKCPCHGSGFSVSGMNLEGPAPRPIERFGIFVEQGIVKVDRSRVYRQEKGQWNDPDSFIVV